MSRHAADMFLYCSRTDNFYNWFDFYFFGHYYFSHFTVKLNSKWTSLRKFSGNSPKSQKWLISNESFVRYFQHRNSIFGIFSISGRILYSEKKVEGWVIKWIICWWLADEVISGVLICHRVVVSIDLEWHIKLIDSNVYRTSILKSILQINTLSHCLVTTYVQPDYPTGSDWTDYSRIGLL